MNGLAMVRGAKYGARQFLSCHGQAETVTKFPAVSFTLQNTALPRAAQIGQSQAKKTGSKSKEPSTQQTQQRVRQSPQRRVHQHLIHASKWIVRGVLGLLAVVGSVYGIWGPPWPTAPEIHPQDVLNGSSLILPFKIQNKSIFFPITDAEMTCGVDWLFVKDANRHTFTSIHTAFSNGTYSFPAGGQPATFRCDASELIKIEPNGSVSFRGMSLELPIPLSPPWQIEKMCVWIGGDYKIAGRIPWQFTSIIFQWPASPGAPQWIEGPTLPKGAPTEFEQIGGRPEAMNCSPSVDYPYMLFTEGTAKQMPRR